jgi:hypothetical protein
MIDTTACHEHFLLTKAFALERGLHRKLSAKLHYLDEYANREGCTYDKAEGKDTRCRLFKDFAPHSFEFVMECREAPDAPWKRWFNGGLIFHDAGSSGVSGEMSVRLGDCSQSDWGIHT